MTAREFHRVRDVRMIFSSILWQLKCTLSINWILVLLVYWAMKMAQIIMKFRISLKICPVTYKNALFIYFLQSGYLVENIVKLMFLNP
jgi:hypothetical protein